MVRKLAYDIAAAAQYKLASISSTEKTAGFRNTDLVGDTLGGGSLGAILGLSLGGLGGTLYGLMNSPKDEDQSERFYRTVNNSNTGALGGLALGGLSGAGIGALMSSIAEKQRPSWIF